VKFLSCTWFLTFQPGTKIWNFQLSTNSYVYLRPFGATPAAALLHQISAAAESAEEGLLPLHTEDIGLSTPIETVSKRGDQNWMPTSQDQQLPVDISVRYQEANDLHHQQHHSSLTTCLSSATRLARAIDGSKKKSDTVALQRAEFPRPPTRSDRKRGKI
jgi:hypothetical protein